MGRIITRLLSTLALLVGLAIPVAIAAPSASACPANWTFGVGGLGDGQSTFFTGFVDTPVHYSGLPNDIEGGIGALARDVNAFRQHCPGTYVVLSGHSQGAAIVHTYLGRGWFYGPGSAVLYADPKQHPTGGIFSFIGLHTDTNFGGYPVRQFCSVRDVICNHVAGWWGYVVENAHVLPYRWELPPIRHAGTHGVTWLP